MASLSQSTKYTGILLHYMGAIMVGVLGHVHGAARESKYTKKQYSQMLQCYSSQSDCDKYFKHCQ